LGHMLAMRSPPGGTVAIDLTAHPAQRPRVPAASREHRRPHPAISRHARPAAHRFQTSLMAPWPAPSPTRANMPSAAPRRPVLR
jgi:hypothetical protein